VLERRKNARRSRRIQNGQPRLYLAHRGGTKMMRLSLKAMAIAAGLLWGGAILCVGLINLAVPSYGMNFIQLTSSVYPWFHASRNVANVAVGTVDGLIDGAIAGMIFALLYNAVTSGQAHSQSSHQQA
jgi:predicted DNA repair protein MutK